MDGLGNSQQLYLDETGPQFFSGQTVTFWAKDPAGKREILLDGKKIIHAIPGLHCDHTIHVTVASKPNRGASYYWTVFVSRTIMWFLKISIQALCAWAPFKRPSEASREN